MAEARPLRCRIGWHKKRLRVGYWPDRTFFLTGINLYECAHCDWHMRGIGEVETAAPKQEQRHG